jgi:hypothetical protein
MTRDWVRPSPAPTRRLGRGWRPSTARSSHIRASAAGGWSAAEHRPVVHRPAGAGPLPAPMPRKDWRVQSSVARPEGEGGKSGSCDRVRWRMVEGQDGRWPAALGRTPESVAEHPKRVRGTATALPLAFG